MQGEAHTEDLPDVRQQWKAGLLIKPASYATMMHVM
jgi:hypothetical protein